jgi:tight adherence protein B
VNLLAASAAALAVWLCFRPGSPRPERAARPPRLTPRIDATRAALLVAPTAGGLAMVVDGTDLALGLILLTAAVAGGRLAERSRRRRAAVRQQGRVVELCRALAEELRAGQPPGRALERVATEWTEMEAVASAARLGSDVPTAIRRLAARDGAGALHAVAGAWQVSSGTGARLSPALDRVVAAIRRDRETQRLVASELASAQATARTVAALPAFALLLGSGIGGSPWHFLLQTPAGLVCLSGGLALALLGLGWIETIAARAVQT